MLTVTRIGSGPEQILSAALRHSLREGRRGGRGGEGRGGEGRGGKGRGGEGKGGEGGEGRGGKGRGGRGGRGGREEERGGEGLRYMYTCSKEGNEEGKKREK